MNSSPWGSVPPAIAELVELLERTIAEHSQRLSAIEWPTTPGDISPALLETLRETEAVFAAAKDLRSVLTAYAHQIHQPRPVMADVARAQGASPQAVATRYTASTVDAIKALLAASEVVDSAKPDPEHVRTAIAHATSEIERSLQSHVSDYVGEIVGVDRAAHPKLDLTSDESLRLEVGEL